MVSLSFSSLSSSSLSSPSPSPSSLPTNSAGRTALSVDKHLARMAKARLAVNPPSRAKATVAAARQVLAKASIPPANTTKRVAVPAGSLVTGASSLKSCLKPGSRTGPKGTSVHWTDPAKLTSEVRYFEVPRILPTPAKDYPARPHIPGAVRNWTSGLKCYQTRQDGTFRAPSRSGIWTVDGDGPSREGCVYCRQMKGCGGWTPDHSGYLAAESKGEAVRWFYAEAAKIRCEGCEEWDEFF